EMKNEQAVSPVIATILMVAITVVLAGVLYVWANSLAADQPEAGTRNSYTASDADASMTAAGGDTMMKIQWNHAEDDLNWAFVTIKVTVGDNSWDCGADASSDCVIGQDGSDDSVWETSEFLTLSEGDDGICDGSCTIDLYVTYRGTQVAGTDSVTVA
ncbi:MAG: archaellin/type IV pilin N-terminal domain-containing protein, partial [Candidatus Thermoplasmatota archaeon]|nr:archaellin/type IV pilin N-terminal domain-containing protein [Candidatus Thermoplasmatota archaeon]